MFKYLLLSSTVLILSVSFSDNDITKKNLFEIKISSNDYLKSSMPKNRHHIISDKVELDKEIIYLKKYFEKEKPDNLIRLFDYILRNPQYRGYVTNNLSMYRTDDPVKRDDIKYILDFLNERTYILDTYNLPNNGTWSEQAGHSVFTLTGNTKITTKNEFLEVAPYGVPFEFGYPNFTAFKIGDSLTIDSPTGSYSHDYDKALNSLIVKGTPFNDIIFTSKEQFNEYLQSTYSNLVYSYTGDSFDLIPIHVSSIINYVYPYYKKKKTDSLYRSVHKK